MSEQNTILEYIAKGWLLRERNGGGYELFMPPSFIQRVKSPTVRAMIRKRLVEYEEPGNQDNRYLTSMAAPNYSLEQTPDDPLEEMPLTPDDQG